MPRGSKKSANQHNNRHENGVVAPGKRIRKQKSNGYLNGSLDGATQSKTPPSGSSSSTSQPAALADKSTNGHSTAMKNGIHASIPAAELRRKVSREPLEENESSTNGFIQPNGTTEPNYRKIDVNAAKSSVTHNGSIFHLAYTILRSCPLADTIAILIFLLSLPQTLLTLTNGLFAVLTFMPPAGTFSSFPATFSDVFQGSGGTPSLATIVLTDIIGLVLWLILWAPLQSLALELAQAVVATTLGGGNTNKTGSSDCTILCMLVVSISHIAHHRWIPNRFFDYEWSSRLSSLPYITGRPFLGDDIGLARSPAGWLSVLIALHIVIQGLVHVARRWYTKREYSQAKFSIKKSDPEAVGASPEPSEDVHSLEINLSGSLASPAELTSKLPIPNLKEPREKVSSGKKKRKQGSYVRSQQPLWAAFAATKVTILREYEQSYALSEAVGANATDTKNLGSAPFANEEGRVWIAQVQPTKFRFDASHFPGTPPHKSSGEPSRLPISAEVDRTKPIYVRINGANWTSTQIEKLPVSDSANESADRQWSGEVFGLSPASSYVCSFVRSEDNVVIYSVRVSTPSSPTVKKESSIVVTPPRPSKRPSSPTTPTTTLKNSITALEVSLSESQSRQKRSKKDSKAALTAIKREIDILRTRISKVNSEDKAHQNRHLQWNQHTRQADEATSVISAEIDSLGTVPENYLNQWRGEKALWDEARDQLLSAREDLCRCKDNAHREQSAVEAEASATQQKRERFQNRQAKLAGQHDRLQSATNQSFDEMEGCGAEHARAEDRRQAEKKLDEIAMYVRAIEETRYHTSQTLQQVDFIESAFRQHQHITAGQGGRVTPEGDVLGSHPHQPTSNMSGFRFPAFAPPDHSTPLYGNLPPLRHETRRRSVSLLSGNSIYTDFSDQDPAPPMPSLSRARDSRRGRPPSYSSGSGSGSVGSQRDQTSPFAGVIGSRPVESPVEKRRSPVWNP